MIVAEEAFETNAHFALLKQHCAFETNAQSRRESL